MNIEVVLKVFLSYFLMNKFYHLEPEVVRSFYEFNDCSSAIIFMRLSSS